jgi:hypothetical protein
VASVTNTVSIFLDRKNSNVNTDGAGFIALSTAGERLQYDKYSWWNIAGETPVIQ